jgi:hypothetical protein
LIENGKQKTENRKQESENRKQEPESRKQKTEKGCSFAGLLQFNKLRFRLINI